MDIKPGQTWKNRAAKEELEVVALTKGLVYLSNGNSTTPDALLEWWDLVRDAPKGPSIITALSHAAESETKGAREMSKDELETALGNWLGWRKTYGNNTTDEGLAFKATARQQLGRIRRELKRRKEL